MFCSLQLITEMPRLQFYPHLPGRKVCFPRLHCLECDLLLNKQRSALSEDCSGTVKNAGLIAIFFQHAHKMYGEGNPIGTYSMCANQWYFTDQLIHVQENNLHIINEYDLMMFFAPYNICSLISCTNSTSQATNDQDEPYWCKWIEIDHSTLSKLWGHFANAAKRLLTQVSNQSPDQGIKIPGVMGTSVIRSNYALQNVLKGNMSKGQKDYPKSGDVIRSLEGRTAPVFYA